MYTDIRVHPTIGSAYEALRAQEFYVLASNLTSTSVVDPHVLIERLQERKIALVFGNEESGISEEAIKGADGSFFIPLSGFTQSLNLSVTVAVTLYSIRHSSLAHDDPGDMPDEEQRAWYDRWVRRQALS